MLEGYRSSRTAVLLGSNNHVQLLMAAPMLTMELHWWNYQKSCCVAFMYVHWGCSYSYSMAKMRLRQLENLLESVDDFEEPKILLEQYATRPHIAGAKQHKFNNNDFTIISQRYLQT